MSWPDSAFWTFSLDLYDRPGVEAACLALQGRHGLNVNLLLWALWLAECGVVLEPPVLARARAALSPWHEDIVDPLRGLRKNLRQRLEQAETDAVAGPWLSQVTALRRRMTALELDCERLEQLMLGRLGDELEPSRRASAGLAVDNLACLQVLDEQDRGDLANLLMQVFPDAHSTRLDAALDGLFSPA